MVASDPTMVIFDPNMPGNARWAVAARAMLAAPVFNTRGELENMSDATTATGSVPVLNRDAVFTALSNPTRVAMLAVLCDGEHLGAAHFAELVGCSPEQAGKNAAVLVWAGLIVRGRGNLYRIVPGLQPVPGRRELELGHCLLRLDHKPPA